VPEPVRIDPATQTARVRVEKRPKGKVVTLVSGLDPQGNDLPGLAARLKAACGTGGTAKDDVVEIQGNHLDRVESTLRAIGYRVKKG
jgi:translation initiation factor 1